MVLSTGNSQRLFFFAQQSKTNFLTRTGILTSLKFEFPESITWQIKKKKIQQFNKKMNTSRT